MENGNTFDKLINVSWLKESKMGMLKEFREFAMRGMLSIWQWVSSLVQHLVKLYRL